MNNKLTPFPSDKEFEREIADEEQTERNKARLAGYASSSDVREFCDALWEAIMERNRDAYDEDWLDLPEDKAKEVNTPRETLREYVFDSTMTLFAFKNLLDNNYDIYRTYLSDDDYNSPAIITKIEIDYDKFVEVYEEGNYEVTEKSTGEKLRLGIEFGNGPPTLYSIGVKGQKANKRFLDDLKKFIEENDIYRFKTLKLIRQRNGTLTPSFMRSKKMSRSELILDAAVFEEIDENILNVFLKNTEYKARFIPTKRGVMFEGPPGNGKSSTVQYINYVLDGKATQIYVTDGVISSGDDLSKIFEMARKYTPTVLVFEDIDTIGKSRDLGGAFMTCELLGQLDGLEKIEDFVVVATTNHPDVIDEALKNRPARFDRRISIPLPSAANRAILLGRYLKEKNILIDSMYLEQVAKETDKFSGAHLQEVVITAQMKAMNQGLAVTGEHLLASVKFLRAQYKDTNIGAGANDRAGFRGQLAPSGNPFAGVGQPAPVAEPYDPSSVTIKL